MSTTDLPASATPEATREALAHGVAVQWWQTTVIVEVAGPDALSFLDGICTQAVPRIEPGTGKLGLFLDAKAKIIAPAMLWRTTDAAWTNPRRPDAGPVDAPRVLLEVPSHLVEPLEAHLRRYRLRAKASVVPTELAVAKLASTSGADVRPASSSPAPGPFESGTTTHGDHAHVTAFFGTRGDVSALVRGALPSDGGVLADPDTWEAARIEAGRPGLHDFLPGRMPAEVGGMEHAVALDGGCYLGQEPVARLHYRGHANRTLRRLETSGDVAPSGEAAPDDAPDAPFELRPPAAPESRAAGRLTTWARRPDGTTVALATVRRELELGAELQLAFDGPTFRLVQGPPEG